MRRLVHIVLVAFMAVGFLSSSAFADMAKGQKIFVKEMKNACGYSGGVMAKKYKQAEWKAIFDSGKLNDELVKQCPSAKPLKDAYVEHVYDFLYNYASDSGNVPSC